MQKIRTAQVAEILNVTVQTVRKWAKQGRLTATEDALGNWYYDPEEVDRLAEMLPPKRRRQIVRSEDHLDFIQSMVESGQDPVVVSRFIDFIKEQGK